MAKNRPQLRARNRSKKQVVHREHAVKANINAESSVPSYHRSKKKSQADEIDKTISGRVEKKQSTLQAGDRFTATSLEGEKVQDVSGIATQTFPPPIYSANANQSSSRVVPVLSYPSLQVEIGHATAGASRGNLMVNGVVSELGQASLEAGKEEMIERLIKKVGELQIELAMKDEDSKEMQEEDKKLKIDNALFKKENERLNYEVVDLKHEVVDLKHKVADWQHSYSNLANGSTDNVMAWSDLYHRGH